MAQSAWERARELVGSCLPLLPPGEHGLVADFVYDGRYYAFAYQFLLEDTLEPMLVTAEFKPDGERIQEDFFALSLITKKDSRFLLEGSIHADPPTFHRVFPDFSCRWDKVAVEGKESGALRFFRIDFSYDDFISYEGNKLRVSLRRGDEHYFKNLPEMLAGTPSILETPIPHRIDYEHLARELLTEARLEDFVNACLVHS